MQVAERQAAGFRDGFEGDVFGIVAADGVHGAGDGLHQGEFHLVLGGSPQDAHDADGALAGVEQRELGHDEPVGQALAVKPKLQALDVFHFAGEEALVVADVVFGHDVRIDIEVGEAEHLFFVAHLVALQDAAAGEHGAPGLVFGEEVHAGDVVKDSVEEAAGVELGEPCGAFLLQGFELAMGSGLPSEAWLERLRIWHRLCRHVAGGCGYDQ